METKNWFHSNAVIFELRLFMNCFSPSVGKINSEEVVWAISMDFGNNTAIKESIEEDRTWSTRITSQTTHKASLQTTTPTLILRLHSFCSITKSISAKDGCLKGHDDRQYVYNRNTRLSNKNHKAQYRQDLLLHHCVRLPHPLYLTLWLLSRKFRTQTPCSNIDDGLINNKECIIEIV